MQKLLIPVGLAIGIGSGWWMYAGMYANAYGYPKIELSPVVHAKYEPGKIDRDIAFHSGRVKADPDGAIGWAMLSGAYLSKSREQDDDASSWKAEEAARRSLQIRRRGNIQGALKLVQALLEQHRFQDALKAADDALTISPGDDQAKLLRADVLIEVGRYDEAREQLRAVATRDPSFLAVQGRWESAMGNHEKSLVTWRRAIMELDQMGHVSEDSIAWYQIKGANELLMLGKPKDAEAELRSALARAPMSYKATLGLAEAALAQGDWKGAVIWSDKTLQMVNSFKAMAIRGEALEKFGDLRGAATQYEQMRGAFLEEDSRYEKLGKGGPLGVRHPDREFATFCATKTMFIEDGLRAAKRDLLNRPDELARRNLQLLSQAAHK